ncbi:arf-GAP with SH3 domain, ANK repeat and PH domain-containing protein 1-like protein [Lates japonicus]|uniref:Arf-GAP with SH3 domain, ANK repeat and PH domain-containing protein 1-like protein n=1 Tax=Lates japonicus TaxID=270547 RepID=A0AAD3MNN6_LATJO|nr:arf-GAP with SH3 domain, ANK repeat and PH domain-containing protein 1-like protein [Lates japonicus]
MVKDMKPVLKRRQRPVLSSHLNLVPVHGGPVLLLNSTLFVSRVRVRYRRFRRTGHSPPPPPSPPDDQLRNTVYLLEEYLIKVNEIKTKRGVDLLQNLIKHYHSHNNFLQECVSTTQRLKQYMEELNGVLTTVKQRREEEKRQLCALRDQLRPVVHTEQDSLPKQVYSMHQLLGDKQYGTERTGFLYKNSDGLRKMWQKRKCSVHNCYLNHLTCYYEFTCVLRLKPNKPPTRLNLLTCQVKPSVEDKKCFDLISHNRTYHFLAEDEAECVAWISVLSNSKQEALSVALDGGRGGGRAVWRDLTTGPSLTTTSDGCQETTAAVTVELQILDGSRPTWES